MSNSIKYIYIKYICNLDHLFHDIWDLGVDMKIYEDVVKSCHGGSSQRNCLSSLFFFIDFL